MDNNKGAAIGVSADQSRIEKIFSRGIVVDVLPTKEGLMKRLLSGERLRIYIGADPTSKALHLSHAKNYLFLEELRQLGHETIILIGDFTAQIGDPTDRSDMRPQLTEAQVQENVNGWISQIRPLMGFDDTVNPPKVLYNSTWLSRLSCKDVLELAANFTVQQMIERDMFEKRWEEGAPIYLHEFLYPLMQGYDSVAMDVDVELCGTDQIFNALAGRTLMKRLKNKEKFVIALNLMANPKTGALMSKSKGNGVFLSSPPADLFGAIMAQPDEMIEIFFVNNTRLPLEQKDTLMALGPRAAKARVALEITTMLYGEEAAQLAQEDFTRTFSDKGIPADIPTITVRAGSSLDALVPRVVSSQSELRRLREQGAIRAVGSAVIRDPDFVFEKDIDLRIGKHRFVKIIVG